MMGFILLKRIVSKFVNDMKLDEKVSCEEHTQTAKINRQVK